MLTTIIATRNRADALKGISMPSLLGQDCSDFEIIVWDASDGEDSRDICASFAPDFKNRGIDLRYFRAPRVGLTSQRNDAVKEAKGDFIFFIDDDSEVSADGIGVLIKAFRDNPDRMGIGLPLDNVLPEPCQPIPASFYVKILRALKKCVLSPWVYLRKKFSTKRLNRHVLQSAENVMENLNDSDGNAEWLSGCDMAFRREVFDNILFDERLQKFGGYALAEDVDFSHRVLLRFKTPLLITADGLVRHINISGGRIPDEQKKIAALFFNRFILRQNFGMGIVRNLFYFYSPIAWIVFHGLLTGRIKNLKTTLGGFNMAQKAVFSKKI